MKTIAEIARTFGCTEAQARAQLRANLDGIRTMKKKTSAKGRSINGYTRTELDGIAAGITQSLSFSPKS